MLLTLENLADRSQYVNARNTFTELLAYGTIPVVNENVSWDVRWPYTYVHSVSRVVRCLEG